MNKAHLDRALVDRMLVLHEGCKREPYPCTSGRWTVGVGRNFQDNPFTAEERAHLGLPEGFWEQKQYLFGHPLTTQQIDWLLHQTENQIFRDMERSPSVSAAFDAMSPVRQAVMFDMAFNLGVRRLEGFHHFLQACKTGDSEWAAAEMVNSKWYRQTGSRARRLVKMMRSGVIPPELQPRD